MNERKLTKSELAKREDIIMKMKKNKRALTQKYGKDAEAVMYGRATKLAKKQAESMDQDKIKELVKDALQNPKKADLNKDGKLSDYEKKRGAAIEKSMANEMDINDPVAMRLRADKAKSANAGDDGNDKFFAKNAARLSQLKALKDKRAQIMRDMEQEAELEGGPIADRYGDLLNKIDMAISKLSDQGKGDEYMSKDEIERRAAMIGLEEGFYGPSQLDKIIGNIGYDDLGHFFEDNPGAIEAVLNFIDQYFPDAMDGELSSVYEDLDLGHQDNEPHMLKADLYRIGKYAMELYQILDTFEASSEEVDLPHWWQAKIINAKDAIVGAKHYLDFEIKEPQIDAMVDVAQEEDVIDEAKYTDYSNNELAAYCKNNPEDKAAAAELKKRSQKLKDLSRTDIKEGTWSLGSANEIKDAIHTLEMWYELDARQISALFDDEDNSRFFYNVIGDDLFHDALDRAEREAAADNTDRAHNAVTDAIGRAEELLAFVQKREGLNELLDDTPPAVVARANNKIVNVATMAKSLLDIYDDFKAKEKIDFEDNSNFVQALSFLTKAAQPQIDKETKNSIAEKLAKQLKSK